MTVPYGKLLGRALNLLRDGQPAAADAICRHVLIVDPNNAPALYLAGVVAHDLADHRRSFEMMDRALAIQPDHDDAYCGRGVARRQLGDVTAALADFRQAIAINPDHAQANFHLGLSLLKQNLLDEAAEKFQRALAAEPAMAVALANLGLVRHRQNRIDAAVDLYRKAVAIEPTLGIADNNLAAALQELGNAAEALAIWRRVDERTADPLIGANLLTCLNLVPSDPETTYRLAKRWAERHADRRAEPVPQHSPDPERRLRVGYLGGDGFRRHSLAMTYLPLFQAHDRSQIEIVAYSDLSPEREDNVSQRFKANATAWRQTAGLDDQALAELLRADRIDIVVDAAGFSAGSRLLALARRPVPIQVHFPVMGTSGMAAMDYAIGDDRLLPAPVDAFFTERLWRLPCAYLYAPLAELPPLAPPPFQRNAYITFGSFNRLTKISPEAAETWARILRAVPRSRLIIKSSGGISAPSAAAQAARFRDAGVDADRLEFRGPTRDDADHFRQFGDIDIALDPFPHCGVVTTLDTLAMGVPVVSLVGARPLERYGYAILGAIGFDEGLADDETGYVARAVALAADPQRLATLRPALRARLFGSPLCDAAAFARALESAYRLMWRRWCTEMRSTERRP